MSWPWSELGLDGPASLEEVRRAYAQRVKQVHPEEDPEGFQRLHAAYQQARRAARQAQGAGRPGPGPVPERPPRPPEEEQPGGLDFDSLLQPEQEEPEEQEKQAEPGETWDFQRLFQEENERLSQQQELGWDQEALVERALELVRLLFAERRSRQDWERFLTSPIFFQVKWNARFMAVLAQAFQNEPVQDRRIRDAVCRAYGFKPGTTPQMNREFYEAISGRTERRPKREKQPFRKRHPIAFILIFLALVLGVVNLGVYLSGMPARNQVENLRQYLQEDFGCPVESRYAGYKESMEFYYLPEQGLLFTAWPEGERDLSKGELGYATDLGNRLLSVELDDFSETWGSQCRLKMLGEDGQYVSATGAARTYLITTQLQGGEECMAALGQKLEQLSQEDWYRKFRPAYELNLLVEGQVYYTYTAPEEPFDAAALTESYTTQARPTLLRYLLEESGLGEADFGDTPYQLVDMGDVDLYVHSFVQVGGVNETTGQLERLYFYNNLYLISTPAEGFDPNMGGFSYMDFVHTDQFEEGNQRLEDADIWLVDVVRH